MRDLQRRVYSWRAVAVMCLVMVCGFAMGMLSNAKQAEEAKAKEATLQYALTQAEQDALSLRKAIDNVGSDSYVESTARTSLNYMKAGEMRFEVVNSELLDNYTPEELQILADEMAQPDR